MSQPATRGCKRQYDAKFAIHYADDVKRGNTWFGIIQPWKVDRGSPWQRNTIIPIWHLGVSQPATRGRKRHYDAKFAIHHADDVKRGNTWFGIIQPWEIDRGFHWRRNAIIPICHLGVSQPATRGRKRQYDVKFAIHLADDVKRDNTWFGIIQPWKIDRGSPRRRNTIIPICHFGVSQPATRGRKRQYDV